MTETNPFKKTPIKILLLIAGLALLCLAIFGARLFLTLSAKKASATNTPTEIPALLTQTPIPTYTPLPPPPTALPLTLTPTPTPTETPVKQVPRMPGITPSELQAKLRLLNLSCADVNFTELDKQGYYSWSCSRDDFTIQYFVTITSRTLESVDAISASVIQTNQPSSKLATNFLGYIATFPFLEQPVQQVNARTWVVRTLAILTGKPGDIHTTSINLIDYQLFGPETARTLFIGNLK